MKSDQRLFFEKAIVQLGERDPELQEELKTKLTGDGALERFERRALSIISDPSIPIMDVDGSPTSAGAAALESIIHAIGRPVFVVNDNRVTGEFSGPSNDRWLKHVVAAEQKINAALPAVGRIDVTNHFDMSWLGTGWLVGDDVIVTNRHVAVEFGRRDNSRFVFRLGLNNNPMAARVDFLEEYQRAGSLEFAVANILWIAPSDGPDVAFLQVARKIGQPPLAQPIKLASEIIGDDFVATIGYPARDSRIPDQELVKRLFGDVYDKKRLAPGSIMSVDDDEMEHDCSTLGGNSGSVILSLRSGEAVGLHFAGLFKEANYAVPAPKISRLLAGASRGLLDAPIKVSSSHGVAAANAPVLLQWATAGPPTDGVLRLSVNVPIEISVRIGTGQQLTSANAAGPATMPGAAAAAYGDIDAAVALASVELAPNSDVITVRKGYRFREGWITDERVVVVELREKQSTDVLTANGTALIPQQFLGVGVDIRTAPLFDQLDALGVSLEGLELRARPGKYREPSNLALDSVKDRMKAVFHASPDSGFPNLREFIGRVQRTLTATIYEWEPNHISTAIAAAMQGPRKKLTMVTQKKGTDEAVDALKGILGNRFSHVWASAGAGGLVPSAYHIKVASRDGEEFWLSSGNWKDSNQADIDPAGTNATQDIALRKHNREWHAIIAHSGLAKLFQAFIDWDFEEAQRVPIEEGLEPALPDLFIPELAFFEQERPAAIKYFDPLELDRELEVQPLLTPDRDARGNRLFLWHATKMIENARERVFLQNQSFNMLTENVDEFDNFFTTLRDKQQAGLDVRIIFRDGREFGAQSGRKQQPLIERLKDFGFDTRKLKLQLRCHTKGIIVDSDVVLLGSHNLTNEGALFNRDASLLIRDSEVAQYFERIFIHDWENLATQRAEEVVGGVRIARPGEVTPSGFRRVSGGELALAL